ncbi:NCS2 family permease [Francisella sp. 19X1-34]|uniref:NCS2 family permease n=1 Tax=Francisella sp. 19X1-34 TaxID=3087177 RepID=UPI002E35BDBD|nr:NCS2 family permease [Francisella sp. 19X1-34]MED7789369.1 NCS2 family permease [Francisella sp. 19X1-34]
MELKISEGFKEEDFSFKRETVGGITTFLSMMYIIIVNPVILSQAGIPFAGALTATIVVSFIGCILMGIFSNNPIAIAPGMGINAFFTYTVVQQMHVSWQVALGVVFWSGIIFTILSVTNIRTKIIKAIPKQIRYAVVSTLYRLLCKFFIGYQSYLQI